MKPKIVEERERWAAGGMRIAVDLRELLGMLEGLPHHPGEVVLLRRSIRGLEAIIAEQTASVAVLEHASKDLIYGDTLP